MTGEKVKLILELSNDMRNLIVRTSKAQGILHSDYVKHLVLTDMAENADATNQTEQNFVSCPNNPPITYTPIFNKKHSSCIDANRITGFSIWKRFDANFQLFFLIDHLTAPLLFDDFDSEEKAIEMAKTITNYEEK